MKSRHHKQNIKQNGRRGRTGGRPIGDRPPTGVDLSERNSGDYDATGGVIHSGVILLYRVTTVASDKRIRLNESAIGYCRVVYNIIESQCCSLLFDGGGIIWLNIYMIVCDNTVYINCYDHD